MRRTGNLAAYLAWIVALLAILTPLALATAGIEMLADAGSAISAALLDGADDPAVAGMTTESAGWQG